MSIAALQSLLDTDKVSDAHDVRRTYGRDASYLIGDCRAVVWPDRAEDVCALVSWASDEGIDLVPRGAGTGLCGGATPQDSVVVDFSRFSKIGPLNTEFSRIRAQAGVVLDQLNRQVAQHNLFFPVVPSSHQAATIGGMLATNAAGLHAVRYGKMRDWVEEVTLVDGKGQIHQLTGDSLDDAVGREGVTGFIVEAVLRLSPRPAQRTLSLHAFSTDAEVLDHRMRWLADQSLIAMEYLNRHAAAAIGWEKRSYLLLEWEDNRGEVQDVAQIRKLWHARDSLYPALARIGLPVIEDPQIDGERLGPLLIWLDTQSIPAFGHLGVGIVHPCFQPSDTRPEDLYRLTTALGGRVSGEHGIGLKKKAWLSVQERRLITQMKHTYDPGNILNRGKVC